MVPHSAPILTTWSGLITSSQAVTSLEAEEAEVIVADKLGSSIWCPVEEGTTLRKSVILSAASATSPVGTER